MCLSMKVFENKLCYVFVQLPTYFWRIQNSESLKIVFFHVGNLPAFLFSPLIYPLIFISVCSFQNDFKTIGRCLTICKSDMGFKHTDQSDSRQHPFTNFVPSHSPASKISQEVTREQHIQSGFCFTMITFLKIDSQKLIVNHLKVRIFLPKNHLKYLEP